MARIERRWPSVTANVQCSSTSTSRLPAYVDAGSETYVRGVLGNAAGGKQAATLALSAHAVASGRPNGDAFETRRAIEVAGRQWAQFRTPVVFAQPGLQFVDVAVDGHGSVQRRRLFTHVERAPRVLAIGDDRWTAAFPPGAIQAVRKEPSALGPSESIEDFDAIVIDGVPAGAFAPGALARIAAAVSSRKTGLFLANGPSHGIPALGDDPDVVRRDAARAVAAARQRGARAAGRPAAAPPRDADGHVGIDVRRTADDRPADRRLDRRSLPAAARSAGPDGVHHVGVGASHRRADDAAGQGARDGRDPPHDAAMAARIRRRRCSSSPRDG